ncbi:acyltransferase-domain-containing protein [Hortaea werneckii]|nr:acyltransferase-domain-containing protein [Hortaea werneckii]
MAANKKAASVTGAETRSNIGGGGLNLSKPGENNPNPIQHGGMGQAERAFSAASTFLSGLLAISASQFIGAPLKLVDPKFYDGYMAWTKESFAVLMTTITQWWSPTVIRVGGDESMKGQLYVMDDGTLKCNFPHRLVLMANHQLYTDWMYLWWIAYTNKMHGRIYIILKESLKNLPIFGWGAQFYNFIFLSRKWETDRYRFKRALNHLKNPQDPMWLLIFPEGTNLSAVTREKSKAWSNKTGIQDMKHQLLPRTTGLQFCLQELKQTTNWLYDCTIAYEGVPKGMYGQDIFTLRSSFFEGRPPKSVNMYWRRFRISEIPVDNDQAFARWLNNRWREKDYILEYFYKYSHFPEMDPVAALAAAEGKKEPKHAKMITSEVRGGGWDEFLSIFGPITSAAGALGQVDLTDPVNFDKLMAKVAETQQLNLMNLGKAPIAATSQEAIRNALQAANAQKALPKSVIDALMKNPPTTQQGMQQALQKAGNPEFAKKAAQAPAAKASISTPTQQAAAKAASQIQQNTSTPRMPAKKAASVSTMPVGAEASNHRIQSKPPQSPLVNARKAMPLANPEAMVTRPLTTMAMQTATSTARNALAQRTKEKGTALPGQGTKVTKQEPNGAPKTGTTPAKSANFGQKPATQNVPLTAANLNAAAKQQQQKTSGSKPLGTQKYVNGKKVG